MGTSTERGILERPRGLVRGRAAVDPERYRVRIVRDRFVCPVGYRELEADDQRRVACQLRVLDTYVGQSGSLRRRRRDLPTGARNEHGCCQQGSSSRPHAFQLEWLIHLCPPISIVVASSDWRGPRSPCRWCPAGLRISQVESLEEVVHSVPQHFPRTRLCSQAAPNQRRWPWSG